MFNFKRDWLYSAKVIYICFVIAQVICLLLGILVTPYQVPLIMLREFYQTLYQLSVIFIMIYPIYALKMISPKRSNFFDANLTTAGLPFTKKQLFLKSIKHWFYLAPLYLVGQFMINYFLSVVLLGVDVYNFFYDDILNPLFVTFILIAIVLQSIAAIIKCLADNVKWYWLMSSIIVGNLLYLFMGAVMIGRIGAIFLDRIPEMEMLYIPVFILIIISAIICGVNFKKIEKICQ